MGYRAWGSGEIVLADVLDGYSKDRILYLANEVFSGTGLLDFGEGNSMYSVLDLDYYCDRYDDEDVRYVLEEISKVSDISNASIAFHGDDDCFWKFIYEDGEWDDITGDIIWQDDKFADITDDEILEELYRGNIIGKLYLELMDMIPR